MGGYGILLYKKKTCILFASLFLQIRSAFFLIYYTQKDLLYYLPLRELEKFWKRMEQGGRKSFRFDELNEEYFFSKKTNPTQLFDNKVC